MGTEPELALSPEPPWIGRVPSASLLRKSSPETLTGSRGLPLTQGTTSHNIPHPAAADGGQNAGGPPPYLAKSGEREMTCWNSERLMVPSLSMSDSSRI